MPKVRLNVDAVAGSFLNMVLSLRGSERQAPNVLQIALRSSAIMEIRANEGVHAKDLNTEQRLRKVIAEYQETPGFLQKWALDDDKVQAILNIIIGTFATNPGDNQGTPQPCQMGPVLPQLGVAQAAPLVVGCLPQGVQ